MFTGLNRFLLVFRDETNLVYYLLIISLAHVYAFIFGTIKLVLTTLNYIHTGHTYSAILLLFLT